MENTLLSTSGTFVLDGKNPGRSMVEEGGEGRTAKISPEGRPDAEQGN